MFDFRSASAISSAAQHLPRQHHVSSLSPLYAQRKAGGFRRRVPRSQNLQSTFACKTPFLQPYISHFLQPYIYSITLEIVMKLIPSNCTRNTHVCPTTLVFANQRTRIFLDVPMGMKAKIALPRRSLGTSLDSGLPVGIFAVVQKCRLLGHRVCPKGGNCVLNKITPLQIQLLILMIQTSNSAPSRGLRRCRRVRSWLCWTGLGETS